MIDEAKQRRLAERGWRVGSADDFLELSVEESAYVDLRLRLSDALRAKRQQQRLTQVELARRIKSSQSRIAKMEAGDASISLDLLIRSLFALGASNRDLAEAISGASATVA
ncbi:MAG TPA: helix-turn-helix transcriptional regulator [Lamprocystis sp. (in: g-proteobacteria)]|nr:helix-turn-helix transcriptional regulator [Lamprocystis sp. (in: g-proteobacteria)]